MSYTIVDVFKDLVTGKLKFASRPTRGFRQTLCDECEVRDASKNVCTACGCWIPAKVRLAKSNCPLGLW